jgi:hypothetical protein
MKSIFPALLSMAMMSCLCGCVSQDAPAKPHKAILFRARIVEAMKLKCREVQVSLSIMHVGADHGKLVAGQFIKVRFSSTSYLDLYGRPWARNPAESVGFADNYLVDQNSDGSFSNLRFAPPDSTDVVIRGNDFWDRTHTVFSIVQ